MTREPGVDEIMAEVGFEMAMDKGAEADRLRAEVERLKAENEWLRGVMRNAIAAQDFEIARSAPERKL